MLQEVLDLQNRAVTKLIEKLSERRELTFRAPTGSGKTYMMSDLMNRILSERSDVVFLVSTLSKGGLAEQNYTKFMEYSKQGNFKNLCPYLINTQITSEERLFIPLGYNVYVLPRDLYKEGGLLMQGAMNDFLQNISDNIFNKGLNKKIYVIKDECHQATNNLDSLSKIYFDKIINFSATPNLKRGQNPDVQITDDEAVNANLIKRIELGNENDSIEDAITKFEEIKESYRNHLRVNPCLIIQISNKNKAEEELNNVILPVLDKEEHQDLKWMIIVDGEKGNKNKASQQHRRTNDSVGKRLPIKRWKDYAKKNTSTIDVIIFKMVISEGWDIPRACMLYQIRDTKSSQLDEQVVGRVRRNPRLMDFEQLSEEAQRLATTAWIWGVIPDSFPKTHPVCLSEKEHITNQIKIRTTRLGKMTEQKNLDIEDYINTPDSVITYNSIFDLNRKLAKHPDISKLCYETITDHSQWFKFMGNFETIKNKYEDYTCNYEDSMELVSDDNGEEKYTSFPVTSLYTDNGNYIRITDWVWKRKSGANKFSFDSEAEAEWAELLKDLSHDIAAKLENKKGTTLFNENSDDTDLYLWGKNYQYNSEIRFEYYLHGIHYSYPDFILKDKKGRINLFEIKSLNIKAGSSINHSEYQEKTIALKSCYKHCSKITGHIFYLPILKEDRWIISQFLNGEEKTLTEKEFKRFITE